MKYIVLIVFCAVTATRIATCEQERINGENGWYVPHKNGSFKWFDIAEYEDHNRNMIKIKGRFSFNPVTFYLYTRSNPKYGEEITTSKKYIDASYFDARNPTRICIHGWTASHYDAINHNVRDAWLSKGEYNFIFVDWARARSIDYASSAYAVEGVGKQVAALIDFLVYNYGMDLNTLEIIGHSLGAHVAGFTGKNIKSGQAHTIVGLDPALPLFSYSNPRKRLCSTDAKYVESIQTNGGKLGFLKPIGSGAFYPNGGKVQPGCSFDITGVCSHSRAIDYYVEAVGMDDFISVICQNYEDAVSKDCGSSFSSVRMGAIINAYNVAGTFYVPVNDEAPYGKITEINTL